MLVFVMVSGMLSILMYMEMKHAPRGYQDKNGFHYGDNPDSK